MAVRIPEYSTRHPKMNAMESFEDIIEVAVKKTFFRLKLTRTKLISILLELINVSFMYELSVASVFYRILI